MATQILTSELDFDTLKTQIKNYLSQYDDFTDYDFNGSGLNYFIEALAFNTQQLAKISNFTLNESFLDTAQLRSSLVSHAKALGYVPRSRLSAKAVVDVATQSVPASTPNLTLPTYTKFSTTIDNTAYNFYTLNEYTTSESDDYIFLNVDIYEGNLKTKKFFIDAVENEFPVYIIPDKNLDRTTLTALIRNGINSTDTTTLTRATELSDLDAASNIYLINEAPNGYWEITLGDGFIGVKPNEGTILEVTYLVSSGETSNNATTFSTSETVSGYALSTTLVTKALGGSEKEGIESIRFNAPLAFSAQNRLVTLEDYKSYISNNVSFVEALNIWGGADNDDPEYGKVFIALKPTTGDTMTSDQQVEVEQLLNKKSVLNITPKFTDPEFEYLDINITIRYNNAKTSLSKKQIETNVNNIIEEYESDNLINFASVFRKSNLLTAIDNSDVAINSSDADVAIRKRFFPTLGASDSYNIFTTSDIKNPTTSTTSVFTSTGFTYTVNGTNYTAYLRNKVGSTTLQLYRLSGATEVIILSNAGSIDLINKKISIGPFAPTAFLNASKGIEIIIQLSNDDKVKPLRNMLLRIDDDATSINAVKDDN